MRLGRQNLKLCTLAVTCAALLFVWYLLGGPVIAAAHDEWYPIASSPPAAIACLEVFFVPLNFYHDHAELPGSRLYQQYVTWCYDAASPD